jgi:hypothetical protein
MAILYIQLSPKYNRVLVRLHRLLVITISITNWTNR